MDDVKYVAAGGPNDPDPNADKNPTKRPEQADATNFVDSQLAALSQDEDLSRFIL